MSRLTVFSLLVSIALTATAFLNAGPENIINQARKSVQKARHTFAGELLILERLNEPGIDETTYLERYQSLMDLVAKRYKKEHRNVILDIFPNFFNELLWGKKTVRTPLSHFDRLLSYTITNVNKNNDSLRYSIRSLSKSSPKHIEAATILNDLQKLTGKLVALQEITRNNQYEFERKEIKKLFVTGAIVYGIFFFAYYDNIKAHILREIRH